MLSRLRFVPLRVLQAVPVAFGVTLAVFFLSHLIPGNPAEALLGPQATPARVAALTRQGHVERRVEELKAMQARRWRWASGASALVAGAMTLAACSGGGTAAAGPSGAGGSKGPVVRGGNLTIADAQDAKSMNNILTFDNTSIFIFEQMLQPLFTVTSNGKGTKPLLAKGYTVSADKKTYTITLKPGIKFSTGKPVTSKDVKFSIDQDTAHASTGWGYINAAIQSVDAPNPSTVVIHLKHPWAPLIADLSLFSNAVVPANYDGKTMKQFYQAPVGTGPFMWGSWQKGQQLKLVKNPNYWQKGKPYLDSVTFTVVPDSNTRSLQVEGGQAGVDQYPDWSSFQPVRDQPAPGHGRHRLSTVPVCNETLMLASLFIR